MNIQITDEELEIIKEINAEIKEMKKKDVRNIPEEIIKIIKDREVNNNGENRKN